jgi:S-adenosylmethionine hydrolase
VITLTTDFGTRDPYVGVMKAAMLQRLDRIDIIDLTHEVAPFRPEEAGFWLQCCRAHFPDGSVHVAVVDPGVGTERALLAVRSQRQLFLAPDNGLLGLLCQTDPCAETRRIEVAALTPWRIATRSATFHGRDILGPLAAELAAARCQFEQLGPPAQPDPGRLEPARRLADGTVKGVVAAIDRYGNLLTTVDAGLVAALPRPQVHLGQRQFDLVRTYGEATAGAYVALINSFGVLEIARSGGSAAAGLAAEWGANVTVASKR